MISTLAIDSFDISFYLQLLFTCFTNEYFLLPLLMEILEEDQPAIWLQIFLKEFILIIIKIYLFRVEERLVLFDSGKL